MQDPKKIEKLAMNIRKLLLKYDMWQDVYIYYNGLRLSTYDSKTKKFHYNEDVLCIDKEAAPERIIPNAPTENHILSMVFEGPFCSVINYYGCSKKDATVRKKFNELLEKNGLYFEQYHHYNLTCYEN